MIKLIFQNNYNIFLVKKIKSKIYKSLIIIFIEIQIIKNIKIKIKREKFIKKEVKRKFKFNKNSKIYYLNVKYK